MAGAVPVTRAGRHPSTRSGTARRSARCSRARQRRKSWRADALHALARGGLRAPKPTTVREAWEEWYEGALAGTVRNKSGDRYKPSSLRDYERNMRLRVLPELGGARLTDVRRPDLQEFADGLLADGTRPVNHPDNLPAAPSDLPPRAGEGRGRGEPMHRPRAPGRPGPPRTLRLPGGGRGADRRRPRAATAPYGRRRCTPDSVVASFARSGSRHWTSRQALSGSSAVMTRWRARSS